MADPHSQVVDVTYTWTVCLVTTTTTFIKSDLPPEKRHYDKNGNPTVKKWFKQRLQNEAEALKLIASRTTIPVPRFIECGEMKGVPYLKMERIHGIECDMVGDKCRIPGKPGHCPEGRCNTCQQIANTNAERFITQTVLPQLQTLRSNQTGLNGFVLPSVWVLNHDQRPYWQPKVSDTPDFVFCLGDLSDHNLMCDEETLEVTYLYDLEHSGYFPPECQMWSIGQQAYSKLFKDTDTLERHISLIEP